MIGKGAGMADRVEGYRESILASGAPTTTRLRSGTRGSRPQINYHDGPQWNEKEEVDEIGRASQLTGAALSQNTPDLGVAPFMGIL